MQVQINAHAGLGCSLGAPRVQGAKTDCLSKVVAATYKKKEVTVLFSVSKCQYSTRYL